MKKTAFLLMASITFAWATPSWAQSSQPNCPNLIPNPVRLTVAPGSFTMDAATVIYIDPSASSLAKDAATYFTQTVCPASGMTLPWVKTRPSQQAILFTLAPKGSLPAEGYSLTATSAIITLSALDGAGFFYAVQTLLQLLPAQVYQPTYQPDQDDPSLVWQVPCVSIEDYPRFSHRGMMLDVSRQFYSVAFVKKYIDWMAKHKLNRFHWHLADDNGWRIEIKKYPLLTSKGAWRGQNEALAEMYGHVGERYGGFYTQQEIKDIVAYASARHVEIIPEIDLPGHSKAVVMSYPEILCDLETESEFSAQGMTNNVWCASREENYVMLENIIKELVALFPYHIYHMGGDEVVATQWLSCQHCKAFMKEKGMDSPRQLQYYFSSRLQQILKKYGKDMEGWDEILDGGVLEQSAVVHAWRSAKKIAEAVERGYRVVAQPAQTCYFDMKYTPYEHGMVWAAITDVQDTYRMDPIADAHLTPEQAKLVLGVQGGLWSEILDKPARIAEYQTYPRLCALAETGWSPQASKNWEDFNKRLSLTHFDRMYYMGIRFRIPSPDATLANGYICASTPYPWMVIRYTTDGRDPGPHDALYTGPIDIRTCPDAKPEHFRFASFFKDDIRSQVREVALPYSRLLTPTTTVTGNVRLDTRGTYAALGDNNPKTFVRCLGQLKEDNYVLFTFDEPVSASKIQVLTGVPNVYIDCAHYAHVAYSVDGENFINVEDAWKDGRCSFIPKGTVKAVKLSFDNRNQTLNTYLQDLLIYK